MPTSLKKAKYRVVGRSRKHTPSSTRKVINCYSDRGTAYMCSLRLIGSPFIIDYKQHWGVRASQVRAKQTCRSFAIWGLFCSSLRGLDIDLSHYRRPYRPISSLIGWYWVANQTEIIGGIWSTSRLRRSIVNFYMSRLSNVFQLAGCNWSSSRQSSHQRQHVLWAQRLEHLPISGTV